MPFFLLFFFIVGAFANTITIENNFANLHRICIYNKEGTSINAVLKVNTPVKICENLEDASGILGSKCAYQKVSLEVDNLRQKVVYYILNLSSSVPNLKYKLTLSGSELWGGECPSNGIAKIANTTPANIAGGAFIAGILTGLIFFAGVVYALIPPNRSDIEEI